jgi:hypothetical protein
MMPVVVMVVAVVPAHRHFTAAVLAGVGAGRIFVGQGRRGRGREKRGARRGDQ